MKNKFKLSRDIHVNFADRTDMVSIIKLHNLNLILFPDNTHSAFYLKPV